MSRALDLVNQIKTTVTATPSSTTNSRALDLLVNAKLVSSESAKRATTVRKIAPTKIISQPKIQSKKVEPQTAIQKLSSGLQTKLINPIQKKLQQAELAKISYQREQKSIKKAEEPAKREAESLNRMYLKDPKGTIKDVQEHPERYPYTTKAAKENYPDFLSNLGAYLGYAMPSTRIGMVGLSKPVSSTNKVAVSNARKVLGVKPNASPAQIKQTYLNLAKKAHPDVGGSTTQMTKLNNAFETLTSAKPESNLSFNSLKQWVKDLWTKKPTAETKAITTIKPGTYTPQEVQGLVIKSKLANTPDGKKLIKTSLEAQRQNKMVSIEKPAPKPVVKPTTPKKNVLTAPTKLLVSHEGAPDTKQVEFYKKQIEAGKEIDPLKVIREGEKYGIEDGKHKFQAYKELGIKDVPIEIVEAKSVGQAPVSDIRERIVYRGEGGKNKFTGQSGIATGRNFATDIERAKKFGDVKEYILPKNAKVAKVDVRGREFSDIEKELGLSKGALMRPEKVKEELLKMGYDAIEYKTRLGINGKITDKSLVVTDIIELKEGILKAKSTPPAPVSDIKPKPIKVEPKEVKVKPITERSIENIKNIKDVKKTLKNIRKEYEDLTLEVEGRSIVAQEQRSGLNTDKVAKLKRIYAVSKTFQEGDIETIRASKHKDLLNSVIENIQEIHPEMDEQEAFDFALELPTKAEEIGKKPPELIEAIKKEKTLRKYLESLKEKQKTISTIKENALYDEWKNVVAIQEKLEKIIEVSRTNIPIGGGDKKVSTLEARVKKTLDNVSQEQIDNLGLSTYNQMNNKETIKLASEYVINNPDDALKVLSGEINPPKGLNTNSIYVAMVNNSSGNIELATKLASISSTAMGQNIEILKELDKDSPVKLMSEVVKFREKQFAQRYKNRPLKEVKKKVVKEIKAKIKAPNKYDWNKFIDSIETC